MSFERAAASEEWKQLIWFSQHVGIWHLQIDNDWVTAPLGDYQRVSTSECRSARVWACVCSVWACVCSDKSTDVKLTEYSCQSKQSIIHRQKCVKSWHTLFVPNNILLEFASVVNLHGQTTPHSLIHSLSLIPSMILIHIHWIVSWSC